MESFLQQYGLAILTIVVIALLILMATPIGGWIRYALEAIITQFLQMTQNSIVSGEWTYPLQK